MKEVMIFARHTRKWEFAHTERLDVNGITLPRDDFGRVGMHWWVRRDGSTICKVGSEVAQQPVPKAPKSVGGPIRDALDEACQLILTHAVNEDAGEEPPDCAMVLAGLAQITNEEWDFIRSLVAMEWECNENPLAGSLKKKLGE